MGEREIGLSSRACIDCMLGRAIASSSLRGMRLSRIGVGAIATIDFRSHLQAEALQVFGCPDQAVLEIECVSAEFARNKQ